jgi:ElaB/YqjD/DUF883 family membrane-anchored ribosome-binding protein
MSIATEFVRGTRRTADAGVAELSRFRARLDRNLRDARRTVSRRAHAADRYVHGHPWAAVAVAAGVAAVAGLATARLLQKRR